MSDQREKDVVHIAFMSAALPDDNLRLRGVWGREDLSRLFTYRLLLVRPDGPLTESQIGDMLNSHCAICLGTGDNDVVQGILESVLLVAR